MNDRIKDGYIDYDAQGNILRVRCMNCGEMVGLMDEMPSKKFPGKTFMQFKRLSNWREATDIPLTDGSILSYILCAGCVAGDNGPINQDDILTTHQVGWEKSARALGRSESDIKKFMDAKNQLAIQKEVKSDARDIQ